MLCYKVVVVSEKEKKDHPLALRVPASIHQYLVEISREHDRPLGYVARELIVRGLNLYQKDGVLKEAERRTTRKK